MAIEQHYDLTDAAHKLGLGRRTLEQACADRQITFKRAGGGPKRFGKIVIAESELERWFACYVTEIKRAEDAAADLEAAPRRLAQGA